jgi:hypothetical protein
MPRSPAFLGVLPGLLASLLAACRATGPEPQQATFPPGERIARSDSVALELGHARYDLRQVFLTVSLTNRGAAPVSLERDGILLAYGELEFPVLAGDAGPAERTMLAPGQTVQLELGFGTEQLMVQAASLHVLSLRTDAGGWLAPLRLVVPPPAAFVEAAAQPDDEEPY